jgi:hypothetical protein
MNRRRFLALAALSGGFVGTLPAWAATFGEKIKDEEYLAKLRRDSRRLSRAAMPDSHSGEFLDVRAVLHAHSGLSHDSRGTEPEILAAAKATNTRAVFMTEHPTADRKWLTEGLKGDHDGVLFIPGVEMSDGLLVWRGHNVPWTPDTKVPQLLEMLKGSDGVAFIAHPEHRTEDADWNLPYFAGMEIYNTHADAVDSGYDKVLANLKNENPLKLLQMLNTIKKYQQEAFSCIFDPPLGNLKRWDTLNHQFLAEGRRVVGIGANDSHRNVGVSFEIGEDLVIRDELGKVVSTVSGKKVPLFLFAGADPNSLKYTFDPYEVSFRHVGTHLLAREVAEPALFEALLGGRAYVSFDWLADPSGFRFYAATGNGTVEMGGTVKGTQPLALKVRPNMPCEIRLIRDGEQLTKEEGAEFTYEVKEPGVYRAECWVRAAEEPRPWIYSNPIYVTGS